MSSTNNERNAVEPCSARCHAPAAATTRSAGIPASKRELLSGSARLVGAEAGLPGLENARPAGTKIAR
jgi:hypothetical protein